MAMAGHEALGEQYFVGRGGGECVGVKKGVGSEKK
jgi:hypothetical protein